MSRVSSINDVMVRGGGGQGLCDNNTKPSVIKCVTMGGGGSKNVQSCVTSFMDDPWVGVCECACTLDIEREMEG